MEKIGRNGGTGIFLLAPCFRFHGGKFFLEKKACF